MKKSPTAEWSQSFLDELSKYVLKGQYKEGLVIAKRALKIYPKDFVCLYQYAKLLGDWADELPVAKRKKLKLEAAKVLRPLTRRMSGQPAAMRFGVCLNYYYQSYAFQDMFAFGTRFQKFDRRKGYYAQALGAGLLAEKYYQSGQSKRSATWAAKSNHAWEKYGLKGEAYYFAHYSYAKSLAIAGDERKAMASLKMAAKVSQRPITDWEFKDVLEIIAGLSQPKLVDGKR